MSREAQPKKGCSVCGAKKTLRRVGDREFCKAHKAEAEAAAAEESRATSARHDADARDRQLRQVQTQESAPRRR